MPDASDVPAAALLPRLAQELRSRATVQPPPWAAFVKTGAHKQKAPTQLDWWYLRSASVLRKISLLAPAGVARLSHEYGGKQDRGSAPYHARSGSRSVTREIVHQLQGAGLVRSDKNRGRILTADGMKLVASASRATLTELAKGRPELQKYL